MYFNNIIMITYDDIGKKVFLRMMINGNEKATWENEGARLLGITGDGSGLIVRMPNGEDWKLKPEVVRIFNPRPK